MPKFLEGFKNFIMRGNAIDLAVGVVIGAAFNGVVNSLVKDLLTPTISAIAKIPDFSRFSFTINGSTIRFGDLINNLISFFLVAVAIYFFVITPMNAVMARVSKGKAPKNPTTKQCPECLSEIPISAKRCAFCGQVVQSK